MVLCVPGEHSTVDSIPSPHHPGELNTEGRRTEKVSRRQEV